MIHTQLEKHKLEARQCVSGSPNDVHVLKAMMILYGGQIAVGDWCYI